MYFARLVRSLWKDKLTKPGYDPESLLLTLHILTIHRSLGLQQSNFEDKLLVTLQKNLFALKEFLDTNPHLFHSVPGEHTVSRTSSGNEQEAWKVIHFLYREILAQLCLGRAKFCVPTPSAVIQDHRSDLFHPSAERLQAWGADGSVSIFNEW